MSWNKILFVTMGLFVFFILGLSFYMLYNSPKLYDQDYYSTSDRDSEIRKLNKEGKNIVLELSRTELKISLQRNGYLQKVKFIQFGGLQKQFIVQGDSTISKSIYHINIDIDPGLWDISVYGKRDESPFLKRTKIRVK